MKRKRKENYLPLCETGLSPNMSDTEEVQYE